MGIQGYVTQQPKVIIFDWDDTICPSSFFDRQQIEKLQELPKPLHTIFAEIARCAERCLHEASKYGEVIIISNSDEGWIQWSCERIVPDLLPALSKYRIVSARTSYEKFYPGQPLCWKAAAFAHEVNETFQEDCPSLEQSDVSTTSSNDERKREIISFGDSMEERTAVKIVSDQLDSTPKSVMFIPSPTPLQIIGQLNMLANHMKFVCEHEDSLDLEITVDQATRFAETYWKKRRLDSSLPRDMMKLQTKTPKRREV